MERQGKLLGKVAVVTGGGSGLGRAASDLFAAEGALVYVVDRDAGAAKRSAVETGERAIAHAADVSSATEMAQLARRVLADQGRVDVVFANAGIEGVGTAADLDEEDWDRVIDVNLKGVWLTSKYFLPTMVEQGSGSIVNTASIGGLIGVNGIFPYAAAKGGVLAMTRQMAADYSPSGIRVNAICPGTVVTPLVERNWVQKGQDVAEQVEKLVASHPLRKAGEPADIAAAALYLACDDSKWVTGQSITVDGGRTMV